MKKLIKFKQEFLEKILDGSKTQTMRLPVSRVDVAEEDIVIALFPNGEEIPLKITKVGYKSFKSINDEDAKREGFSNAEEKKIIKLKVISDDSELEDDESLEEFLVNFLNDEFYKDALTFERVINDD